MKIGKYVATAKSADTGERGYVGTANLLWDEGDSTWETAIHFHKAFATSAEAEAHALQQVELRVKDGKL
jgi:hypothetical protein